MIVYKQKSIDEFLIWIIDNSLYQSVVCYLPCGIVCFVYINPHKKSSEQSDLINKISEYSKNDQFLSVIGDLNIRSEMGSDISGTLRNIFKKLRVKSAFQSITHNLNGQLEF